MKHIGIKIIDAVPMDFGDFCTNHRTPPPSSDGTQFVHNAEGYEVTYPDGYCSWSPKAVFESAYFPMTDSDGTHVSQSMVDAFVGTIESHQMDIKSTISKSETVTGFVQYEVSSCADPKNFDNNIGIEENTKKIKDTIWKCLGFVVQWGLKGINQK